MYTHTCAHTGTCVHTSHLHALSHASSCMYRYTCSHACMHTCTHTCHTTPAQTACFLPARPESSPPHWPGGWWAGLSPAGPLGPPSPTGQASPVTGGSLLASQEWGGIREVGVWTHPTPSTSGGVDGPPVGSCVLLFRGIHRAAALTSGRAASPRAWGGGGSANRAPGRTALPLALPPGSGEPGGAVPQGAHAARLPSTLPQPGPLPSRAPSSSLGSGLVAAVCLPESQGKGRVGWGWGGVVGRAAPGKPVEPVWQSRLGRDLGVWVSQRPGLGKRWDRSRGEPPPARKCRGRRNLGPRPPNKGRGSSAGLHLGGRTATALTRTASSPRAPAPLHPQVGGASCCPSQATGWSLSRPRICLQPLGSRPKSVWGQAEGLSSPQGRALAAGPGPCVPGVGAGGMLSPSQALAPRLVGRMVCGQ